MDNEKSNAIIDKISSIDYELWQYHISGFRYTLDYQDLHIVLDYLGGKHFLMINGIEIVDKVKIKTLYNSLKKFMDEKYNLSHERKEKMIYEKLCDAQ